MAGGDCDVAIVAAAAAVTRVQSLSQEVVQGMGAWTCLVLICHQHRRTFFLVAGGGAGGGEETNTRHRPGESDCRSWRI